MINFTSVIFRWCTLCIIKMLRYQKIDISEGIDINKTNASKECEFCHYWFFKDIGFKFEEHYCNKCHDLLTIDYL